MHLLNRHSLIPCLLFMTSVYEWEKVFWFVGVMSSWIWSQNMLGLIFKPRFRCRMEPLRSVLDLERHGFVLWVHLRFIWAFLPLPIFCPMTKNRFRASFTNQNQGAAIVSEITGVQILNFYPDCLVEPVLNGMLRNSLIPDFLAASKPLFVPMTLVGLFESEDGGYG